MADKNIQIKVDAAINAEPTLKALRELKQLQKEVVAGSDDFKRIQARINDIGDAAKTAKGQSEDWIDTLSGLPGPLGSIGKGLDAFTSSTNKLGLAFKSLGIGLIVAAIGALTAAFSQNEKMSKKLEPILIAFQKILGGIFAALEPVIDGVLSLATRALPFLTDGLKVVYSAMSSFLQGLGKIGSAVVKLFSGDFKGAWEDAKNSVTGFSDRYDQAVKNFEKGSNEMTEIEKKNLEEAEKKRQEAERKRQEAQKKREEAAKKQLEERKKELDAEIQLEINKDNTDKARLEKLLADRLKLEGLSGKQLELARQENAKKVKEAADADKKVLDDRIKSTEDFNRKIRDLQTNAIVDEVARQKQARQDKYTDDLAALERDAEFIKLSEERKAEIRKTLLTALNNDINKINETQKNKEKEDDLKAIDAKLRILELQGQSLLQGTRAYFENRAAILAETENKELQQLKTDLESKKITQEQYEKAVTATADKYGKLRKQLKQEEVAAIGKIVSASIDAVAGLTAAIASSYDEEAKTSKEAFEKRKKLQVATALMSAASGIVQILTQPSVLPSPLDWIVKGVNAAALAVATGVNISKIKKTQFEAPDAGNQERRRLASGGYVSGPGTSTSDSIPASLSNGEFVMNARSTSAFLPMLTAMNNAGNQARFAAGGLVTPNIGSLTTDNITQAIATGMDRPIKTYVVGQDMSNQQQFDRAIKSRSTI
jgi:hypothetical protein